MKAVCWEANRPRGKGARKKPREEPIPFAPTTVAIELTPGKADLIEWTGQAVIRRDGQTGKPVWDSSRPSIPWKTDEDSADRLRRWLESSPHAGARPTCARP